MYFLFRSPDGRLLMVNDMLWALMVNLGWCEVGHYCDRDAAIDAMNEYLTQAYGGA